MKSLTREQAIKEGYKSFFYPKDGYQSVKLLSEFSEEEIDWFKEPVLCQKEPFHPSAPDAKRLEELIIDHICEEHCENTGDDTDLVFDTLKGKIDFSEISKELQSHLDGLDYFRQTDIKLVKS